MERNWLIRTTQNQILGPVSKGKIIEFIQKNALGLTDEVSSGNGYWIAVKEKDLLDRYVFGDVPQSYNPISEAKTVLAHKENPDLTGSMNLSPANIKVSAAIKETKDEIVLPQNDDLEFPDMDDLNSFEDDITKVSSLADFKNSLNPVVPTSKDLAGEFPDFDQGDFDSDITRVISSPKLVKTSSNELSFEVPEEYQSKKTQSPALEILENDLVLPDQDDLEFPDLNEIIKKVQVEQDEIVAEKKNAQSSSDNTNTKIDPSAELNLKANFTQSVAMKDSQAREILESKGVKNNKAPKTSIVNTSGKIGIHERKRKPILRSNPAEQRDPQRELANNKKPSPQSPKRNDTYLFFILFLVIALLLAVFYYFKEILNKPFPV